MTDATAAPADSQISTWLGLIRSEFRESPGLRLTLSQACRFWGLDELVGTELLAALVDAGFLQRTKAGAFVRTEVV